MTTGEERAATARGRSFVLCIRRGAPRLLLGRRLVALLALPLAVANGYQQYLLDLIMINVVLAVGLNIVKGSPAKLMSGMSRWRRSAPIPRRCSAPSSGCRSGSPYRSRPWPRLVGAMVGVPSFRLEGAYLALATLGLAESVRIFIAVTDYLGASIGYRRYPAADHRRVAARRLLRPTTTWSCRLPLIGTYIAFSILHSDVGRAFKAIREDTLAAAASGINVRKYKLLAFVISALYAGCAGSLAAHMAPGFIHPDDYNLTRMVTVILMVVAGGLGHVWGGVIGAALITLIAEWTRAYYQYEFIIFGLIVVLTMMYMPRGIGGYIDRRLCHPPLCRAAGRRQDRGQARA